MAFCPTCNGFKIIPEWFYDKTFIEWGDPDGEGRFTICQTCNDLGYQQPIDVPEKALGLKPTIIGVSGKKRHGKNAVASILAEDFAALPIAFADPLKAMVMDLYAFSVEQVYGDLKEVVDSRVGFAPRAAMQHLGASVRQLHRDTWARKTIQTIQAAEQGAIVSLFSETRGCPLPTRSITGRWVISDCRHVNEANEIRAMGGVVVLVQRPGADTGSFEDHESELEIDQINPDYILVNNGTLMDLRHKVHALMTRMNVIPIPTKRCPICGQRKPLGKSHRQDPCSTCQESCG